MSAKPVKDAYYGETRYYYIANGQGNTRIPSPATLPMQHKKYECLFAYLPIVFPPPYCVLRPFRKTHWASFTLCLFCNSSWSCVRERFARPGWIISTTNYSQKARWRQSRWHLEHDNKIGTTHYTCYIIESMYLLAAEERIPDEFPLANARGVRHDCKEGER